MFNKVLIANRGEIALRIIRACQELDIPTVAVYSTADKDSLHVVFADESVCIGPPSSAQSYLRTQSLIAAAEVSGADAIHPGYGFLAESADFVEVCAMHGINFIGPKPETMLLMGDKAAARRTMKAAGVPVLPGSEEALNDYQEAQKLAEDIGYPVIIKASAGGGGRGMRVVRDADTMESNFEMARAEAESSFGSGDLYVEKFLENPRHIEVQLLGLGDKNVLAFGERDCSIQRRHQKLIEESPSPAVTPELRKKIVSAAVEGAKAVDYLSAGTMEFLLNPDGDFHFMEMNTRIQVEHPVTEMVAGVDLLKAQLLAALGKPVGITEGEIELRGHAIECRINAEDPARNFLPCPGDINELHFPGGPGVRVDSHVYAGYTIPPHYDSLIAKLITYGKDREEAIIRMKRALSEMVVEGVETTIPFHLKVLDHPDFIAGNVDTSFLTQFAG
ncbi:acetyl-CoA carboxylase biotin carboxylase subunit [candidate division LCP-89 bacterium B3_LCP]|uniref:Biotin carboxylase n=1 Tax=candidate division LCP-89 bacterium B3_LCP TaxID=2012998 RepID=A0A532V3J1_UNCL8|nr:MAG: acetyl-CoA carboxylase biotin carboxylase subunit [candidate division LCP-89 bacterium B3_LCP]